MRRKIAIRFVLTAMVLSLFQALPAAATSAVLDQQQILVGPSDYSIVGGTGSLYQSFTPSTSGFLEAVSLVLMNDVGYQSNLPLTIDVVAVNPDGSPVTDSALASASIESSTITNEFTEITATFPTPAYNIAEKLYALHIYSIGGVRHRDYKLASSKFSDLHYTRGRECQFDGGSPLLVCTGAFGIENWSVGFKTYAIPASGPNISLAQIYGAVTLDGGEILHLEGSNFHDGLSVKVAGNECAITLVNPNWVECATPLILSFGMKNVVVTNSDRTSGEIDVLFNLSSPNFRVSKLSEEATAGIPLFGYSIASTGGTISSFSIAPEVSNGLSFNPSSGLISGTPISTSPERIYTITATNAAGSQRRTFSITVNAAHEVLSGSTSVAIAAPIQKSLIYSITNSNPRLSGSYALEISGNFVEKISNISLDGILLGISSWTQESEKLIISAPFQKVGKHEIQIFNGSVPLLPVQVFMITNADPTSAEAKKEVLNSRLSKSTVVKCIRRKEIKHLRGLTVVCPEGFTKA